MADISIFKRIYPEKDVTILETEDNGPYATIKAQFPDGIFYFVVTDSMVSQAYKTKPTIT